MCLVFLIEKALLKKSCNIVKNVSRLKYAFLVKWICNWIFACVYSSLLTKLNLFIITVYSEETKQKDLSSVSCWRDNSLRVRIAFQNSLGFWRTARLVFSNGVSSLPTPLLVVPIYRVDTESNSASTWDSRMNIHHLVFTLEHQSWICQRWEINACSLQPSRLHKH